MRAETQEKLRWRSERQLPRCGGLVLLIALDPEMSGTLLFNSASSDN
jgi:hypothetical protein